MLLHIMCAVHAVYSIDDDDGDDDQSCASYIALARRGVQLGYIWHQAYRLASEYYWPQHLVDCCDVVRLNGTVAA